VSLISDCPAVALFTADDASAPVLQKLKEVGVRYVALRSAGYDHVDLVAASQLGMHVANVPAYSPYSIAEHAVALLLALNRKIVEGQRLMQRHDFRLNLLVGFDVHGKTVGIIGTGTIGTAFAKIMNGFGAKLIGYDPVKNLAAEKLGLRYVSFDELLRESDVISLHCPLNTATKYMISQPQLEKMKKNCILINTARGGVVNTEHLLEALDNGNLGGACLDVYEHEKKFFFEDYTQGSLNDSLFERLISHQRLIVTGHQGFLTTEALTGIAATTIMNLDYWDSGVNSPNTLL
jgi:D-lactate dehydrogenase